MTMSESRRSAINIKRPQPGDSRYSETSQNIGETKKLSPKGPVDPDTMNDETKVSGETWGDLKERAMKDNYLETSQFVKYLSSREKETLTHLIRLQKE